MIENIKWLFFDVGSTLFDESAACERRIMKNQTYGGEVYAKRMFVDS